MTKLLDSSRMQVGDLFQGTRRFDADEVREFCRLTRDRSPLHWDEAFLSRTRLERPIVPGLLVTSLFAEILSSWDLVAQEVSVRFLQPTLVGESVEATVRITHREGISSRADFLCRNSGGATLLVGKLQGVSMRALMHDFVPTKKGS